jgi:hypothetical protein
MFGRSGCYAERVLFVPPRFARLLAALLDDAEAHFRRDGMPVPPELRDWLADLAALADREAAAAAERDPVDVSESSAWIDVPTAATILGVSERRVRTMAANGLLVAKRSGQRRWLLSADDVADEVDARSNSSSDAVA